MDPNQDNYDLGYIQIIKNEEFLYKDFDLKEKSMNSYNKNHNFSLNNKQFIDEEIDENVRKYYEYFKLNDKNGLICKYKDCEQIEKFEHLMVSHVLKHLTLEKKIQVIDGLNSDLTHDSDQSHNEEVNTESDLNIESDLKMNANNNKTGVYVCDWKACKKTFTYWTPFESHKSEHLIQELLENDRKSAANYDSNKTDFKNLEKYFSVLNKNGKDMFVCKWKTCDFKSCLFRVMSRHIRSVHLNPKPSMNEEPIRDTKESNERSIGSTKSIKSSTKTKPKESSYSSASQISIKTPNFAKICQKFDTNSPQTSPKTSTPNLSSSRRSAKSSTKAKSEESIYTSSSQISMKIPNLEKTQEKSDTNSPQMSRSVKTKSNESIDILHNENINVSFYENNVLLSCKGLQSMAKVSQYFEKKVISGEKTYFCKWKGCDYKTTTKGIAHHINVTHIGCRFSCTQPNCDKVFKTPQSWRTHQKNHICNFGIYGYEKNVIGVCRNENLYKYREKVVVDNKRSFRCTYNGCGALSKYSKSMTRHIHNQHICPHRVDLTHLKYRIQYIKNELTSQQNSSQFNANFNQMFQCKRYECNAKFSVYSDLLKHQNILCKYKKVNKNTNFTQKFTNKPKVVTNIVKFKKTKDKSQDNCNTESNKSNEIQIESKKKINKSSTLSSLNKSQSTSGIDKYYDTKSQSISFNAEINTQTIVKKKYSSLESQENSDKNNKFDSNKKLKTQVNQKINNSVENKFNPLESDGELRNANKLKQYIDRKSIDGEFNYFCKWNDCKHYENSLDRITEHINETHIRFTCDIHNCLKSFKSQDILRVHKINHICGFGIKGRKSIGVCDLDNVRKYRREQVVDEKYVYSCKWSECDFTTESRSIALSHAHNRHICPNREIPKVKLIQRSTVGQRSEANNSKSATNRSLSNQKQ